jgi:TonB family protein
MVAALFVTVSLTISKPKVAPAADSYQIAMLEVAGGSAIPKSPLFMAPRGDRKAEKNLPESRARANAVPQQRHVPKASGSESQTAQAHDIGTSSAAGNGSDSRDATFAFPTFSPKPPVSDRSLLPSSDRQVVVDVKLNAAGEVIGENLVTSMGNALDQLVLTAVKSWRFQPATVNGQAVPSEAEVIFTFGPHYPTVGS